jgi:RNA polymerase sigma-70 factor, ECF subfamily
MSPSTQVAETSQRSRELVDHLFRSRAGQMVAYFTRLLGPEYLDVAEEVVQEALLKALQKWPYSGIPENPAGWLFQVARNTALDAVRHRIVRDRKASGLISNEKQVSDLIGTGRHAALPGDPDFEEQLRDDELRMVLMCCHPALPRDARVALSLKTVGGFSTQEIAKAFLSEEATIAQRLVRAKRQIRDESIGLELPTGAELAQRVDTTLEVIYLMFNEGYRAQSGHDLVRADLCGEALRFASLLAASSVGSPQVHALVALMAFQAARLPARADAAGEMVLLEDQDRNAWDQNLIALGFHHFALSAEGPQISPYHAQAAISATHAGAASTAETDWKAILELYDQLLELSPSPVVALNRVVAVAKVKGPKQALSVVRSLAHEPSLQKYYLLPAVEGRLLHEIGDNEGAAESFRRALELPCSEPEKRFLERKLSQCQRTHDGQKRGLGHQ